MTKIHVVVPVYNACKYLRSAVDSVLNQPYKGIDIVLVNDGSTDGSAAICNEIAVAEERVTVIHQENRGVSAARNAGIQYFLDKEISDKDYFAFLDADDLWAPNVFTEDEALKFTSAVIGYSSYYANETATRYRILYTQQDRSVKLKIGVFSWFANGHLGSYLIQNNILRSYGIRFPNGVKRNEDIIFLQEVGFCCEKVSYSGQVLYIYRMNSASVMHVVRYSLKNAADIACAWNAASSWAFDVQKFTPEMCLAWKKNCEQTAGARMLEAARELAGSGVSYSEVCGFLTNGPYAFLFRQINEDVLADWQKRDLSLYRKSSKRFWLKYYVTSMISRLGKFSLSIRLLRHLRDLKDFPLKCICPRGNAPSARAVALF